MSALSGKPGFFIFVCIISLFGACKKDGLQPEGRIEIAMLDSVNKLRAIGCNCGNNVMPAAPALIWNDQLAEAAAAHAKDMFNRNYFEHLSPEGTSAMQRAQAAGYQGGAVLENIGKGYKSAAAVFAAWKASEGHCMAMMDPRMVEMGAYSYGGFWVQEFGR